MKKYKVTFTEIYVYTKEIGIDDNEDINEVIHEPLNYPMVKDMNEKQFKQLNAYVKCEYDVDEIEDN